METKTAPQTPQEKMLSALSSLPIAKKEIRVYGSQVMITAWSKEAADKWANVLAKLKPATLRVYCGIDGIKPEPIIKVWRVWATL